LFRFISAAVLLALFLCTANAANFSFTGNFTLDDDVELFNFTVGAPSTVTLLTLSYAGGTNAAGDVIARGGFDPILALFDSTGVLLDTNDDGDPADVPTDINGLTFDTFLSIALDPGTYTVSVMQFDNFADGPNLSDGFSRAGEGNFTAAFGCGATQFCDAGLGARDSHWAFDVLNAEQAAIVGVPEPGSILFACGGLALLALRLRKRHA
jgi:hypothetical protein